MRWSRLTGGAAITAPPSPAEVVEVVSAHLSASRRKKAPLVLDGEAPDWRLLPLVERLERQLVIALMFLRTDWTSRGKKAGVSGKAIFRVLARDGGTFDEAAAKLHAQIEDVGVFDVFASASERVTTSLLDGMARPASESWSTG